MTRYFNFLVVGLLPVLASCNYVKQNDQSEQQAVLEYLRTASEQSSQRENTVLSLMSEIQSQQQATSEQLARLGAEVQELNSNTALSTATTVELQPQPAPVLSAVSTVTGEKSVIGRVEWLWLPGEQRYFPSQVNTALDESLIYASDIVRFEREGEAWLRFSVEHLDWPSEIETKVLAHKRFSYPGTVTVTKVPVVSIPIELSRHNDAIEFLIIERKKTYPQFVVGRNFLTDIAVVDVSQKYTVPKDPQRVKSESAKRKEFDDQAKGSTSANGRSAATSSDVNE